MEESRRATGRGNEAGTRRPRVVILGGEQSPSVEIVELPSDSGIGDRFLYLGRTWRITGQREASSVFFAEPFEA